MSAKHTPLSASIGTRGASVHYHNVANHPLSFHMQWRDDPDHYDESREGQEFAAFIVQACNAHAELVAALDSLVNDVWDGKQRRLPCGEVLQAARAALAKVRQS